MGFVTALIEVVCVCSKNEGFWRDPKIGSADFSTVRFTRSLIGFGCPVGEMPDGMSSISLH